MVSKDACLVPEVIEKLQSLIDEQQIRIQEASEEALGYLNQIKSLRNEVFSLKNSVHNAQQGLRDIIEKRNSMCDFHFSQSDGRGGTFPSSEKRTFPSSEKLRLSKKLNIGKYIIDGKYSNENNFDDNENLNYIPAKNTNKEDRMYECQESGCKRSYTRKDSLNRHMEDKHGERSGESRDYNYNGDQWTGHVDPDFMNVGMKKKKRSSDNDRSYSSTKP